MTVVQVCVVSSPGQAGCTVPLFLLELPLPSDVTTLFILLARPANYTHIQVNPLTQTYLASL